MTTADAYVPPQNLEAEESVLGAMMVSETAVASVIVDVHLGDEDFYRQRHRIIFNAIHSLHSRGEPVDALTVTEQLTNLGELAEAGGKEFVSSLASTVPVAGNADHYARIVKANAMLRRLLEASHKIQTSVRERGGEPRDLVEQAERMMFEVAHDTASQDFASITDILERETTRLEELSEGKRDLTGTPSGFADLDKITGGFQPGNLIIFAARPSMGKSARGREHRRLRGGGEEAAGCVLLARDVRDGAGSPVPRVPRRHQRDKLREGEGQERVEPDPQGLEPAREARPSGSTPPPISRSWSFARRLAGCTRRPGPWAW